MNDVIGCAEQELSRVTNKAEAAVCHQRWVGPTGSLALMARHNPALSHYFRMFRRELRRKSVRRPGAAPCALDVTAPGTNPPT